VNDRHGIPGRGCGSLTYLYPCLDGVDGLSLARADDRCLGDNPMIRRITPRMITMALRTEWAGSLRG
jgi:hypothetical protein